MPSELAKSAASIRAAVKAAVTAKTLPPYPDGITFRVQSRRGAQVNAIDIEALHVPRAWAVPRDKFGISRPSAAWSALEAALTGIAAAHYKADGRGAFLALVIDPDTEIKEN